MLGIAVFYFVPFQLFGGAEVTSEKQWIDIFRSYLQCSRLSSDEKFNQCLELYASNKAPFSESCEYQNSEDPEGDYVSIAKFFYVKSVAQKVKKFLSAELYFENNRRRDILMDIDYELSNNETQLRQLAVTYSFEEGRWKVSQYLINCKGCETRKITRILDAEISGACESNKEQ